MGFFKRAAEIVESKVNKFLDKVEDPNATLDLSYEKMLDGLQEVKSHLADVVTEQKSIELQIRNAEKEVAQREEEAKAAIRLNREDLATAALEGKHQAVNRLEQLQEAHDRIQTQANRLKEAGRKFEDRISAFKTQKEVTKATYQAAKAQVRIGESMSGIGKELGGIGETLRRANDKAEQMNARAAAIESLAEEGILDEPFDNRDSVAKELEKIRRDAAVTDDLERLKKELQSE